MNTEFNKPERKLAGEIIAKGLHEDFRRGLDEFDIILKKREVEGSDLGEVYRELYGTVRDFNKFIARRYDALRPKDYDMVIIHQLLDKLYDDSELNGFRPEIKERILKLVENWNR